MYNNINALLYFILFLLFEKAKFNFKWALSLNQAIGLKEEDKGYTEKLEPPCPTFQTSIKIP